MLTQGDSIRVRCTFCGYDGRQIVPSGVELRIYDRERTQIGDAIQVEPNGGGLFETYCTVPIGVAEISIEFAGLDEAGRPVVARAQHPAAWA